MIACIDGDIVSYRCAAVTENEHRDIALYRTDDLIHRILNETGCSEYKIFIGGSSNFRHQVYPEYKSHRKEMTRPKWLEEVRAHLVVTWKAQVADDVEADDLLGINQTEDTICCSIDKDLLQIPGHHYNFVKQEKKYVSIREGLLNFYKQLILGDRTDYIPGYDGKFRSSVPNFILHYYRSLEEKETELEMFQYVLGLYQEYNTDEEALRLIERNGKCLYIMRKENDFWQIPNGHQQENVLLS